MGANQSGPTVDVLLGPGSFQFRRAAAPRPEVSPSPWNPEPDIRDRTWTSVYLSLLLLRRRWPPSTSYQTSPEPSWQISGIPLELRMPILLWSLPKQLLVGNAGDGTCRDVCSDRQHCRRPLDFLTFPASKAGRHREFPADPDAALQGALRAVRFVCSDACSDSSMPPA